MSKVILNEATNIRIKKREELVKGKCYTLKTWRAEHNIAIIKDIRPDKTYDVLIQDDGTYEFYDSDVAFYKYIHINGVNFEIQDARNGKGADYTSDIISGFVAAETIAEAIKNIGKKLEDAVVDLAEHTEIVNAGKNSRPETHVMLDVPIEKIETSGSLQDRFVQISGTVSDLTTQINTNMTLGSTQDLVAAFIDAKDKIQGLSAVEPDKVTGFIGKVFGDNKWVNKVVSKVGSAKTENSSVQKNIDYLFGLIHSKYEELIEVGEGLQKAKGKLLSQEEALSALAVESKDDLAQYKEQSDIPMKTLKLDTQIAGNVEKLRNRLLKINGAIVATGATITALGRDLPALKSDLTDEMAIAGLLNNVDDYQQMYAEVAKLVAEVTEKTQEKTHKVVENLLDLQLNDNHTTRYLLGSVKRTDKFAGMLKEKVGQLADKVVSDAKIITEVAEQSNSAKIASKSMSKLLN